MARKRRVEKVRQQQRRMKTKDRQGDIPNCPSLESIDLEPKSYDPEIGVMIRKPKNNKPQHEEPIPQNSETKSKNEESLLEPSESIEGSIQSQTLDKPIEIIACKHCDCAGCSLQASSNINGQRAQIFNQKFGELLETVGGLILEFSVYMFGLMRYTLKNPTPLGISLIFFGAYFSMFYMELSIAATVELSSNIIWPLIHVMLRAVESFFKSMGRLFISIDDVGQAMYCDLSHVWCTRFGNVIQVIVNTVLGLMCYDQCSFTALALERLRGDRIVS
ncbi:Bm67 [Aphelenchoides besseyi]|nr:Bm67 [Aphelenchoides besseyi]